MGNRLNNQRLGEPCPCFTRAPLKCSRSQERGLPRAVEDFRARFYETYRQEAEDYDREFIKKYDEDLNTTLIFVSLARRSDARVLTSVVLMLLVKLLRS